MSVFLAYLNDFEAMNQVYAEYFGDSRPARSTIEASRLPKGVDVEIDVIASAIERYEIDPDAPAPWSL